MNIIWIDCETTGVNHHKNGITEISIIIDNDFKQVAARTFLMNPKGMVIEPKALEVQHRTIEEIETFPDWQIVQSEVMSFIKEWWVKLRCKGSEKLYLGGHNVIFDRRFIVAMFYRFHGGDIFRYIQKGCVVDTMFMTQLSIKQGRVPGLTRKNLTMVGQYFKLDTEGLHNAERDISLTRELAYLYKKMFGKMITKGV